MISVIVPVYNAVKYIEETVESVLRQSEKDWELLLVDDCSRDDTWELLQRLAAAHPDRKIRIFRQETNLGAARARNRGLAEARGRYIAYLDADDLWRPEKLERQLAFMKKKDAAFSFTGYEFADENGRGTGRIVKVPETINYRQALKNTTIFTSTVMFDTRKIGKENLQMPEIKSEDTALWWQVLRMEGTQSSDTQAVKNGGQTAWGLNENLVMYRRTGGTLSSNKLEALRRIWNLYRRQEGLSVAYSLYNFCFWAMRAVKRRV